MFFTDFCYVAKETVRKYIKNKSENILFHERELLVLLGF